jgi:NAD(P)-dependent dehydrogenase (short-subunit alcohol dehydrogenase family)
MNARNPTAVVIGASSGIGLETVRTLRSSGFDIVAAARDATKLQRAVAEFAPGVTLHVLDATNRTQLDQLFARSGTIDHLVLTLSGGEGGGEFPQLDLKALRRGFEAKFWPQIEAAQASLQVLRGGGGITFVTAITPQIAIPGAAGLGAINGALDGVIRSLAKELAPIRVNAVAPGVIDTPWWDQYSGEQKRQVFEHFASAVPVKRIGRASEVARAVQFLVENGFVTGTIVNCDGGMHLGGMPLG